MKRLFIVLLLVLAPVALGKSRSLRLVPFVWHAPACTEVTGLPWLRFIDANDVVRTSSVDSPVVFREPTVTTEAIAIGATPNVMWAVTADGAIHRSANAGCTWSV